MPGIVDVPDEPVGLEQIGDPLDALPRQPEGPRRLGDGVIPLLDHREDLPAGARLPGRPGQRVPGGRQQPIQAEDPDDQAAEGLARRRSADGAVAIDAIDRNLSSDLVIHDSMLSD
jgi:hypothetical protein